MVGSRPGSDMPVVRWVLADRLRQDQAVGGQAVVEFADLTAWAVSSARKHALR